MAERISFTWHVARRTHRKCCFLCNLPIVVGDEYSKFVGKDDYLYSLCEHRECHNEMVRIGFDDEDGYNELELISGESADYVSEGWLKWYNAKKAKTA